MEKDTYQQIIREHMKSSYLLNDEKIHAILPGFLAALNEHMADLEQKLAEGESASLAATGHTIKGALLNLGLFELADLAYKIEKQGILSKDDTDCPAIVARLKQEIATITGSSSQ
jgi:HPt (histidine-containing phosphotransfer) domain-containing protein